jgi:hypothetical protein
MARLYFGGAHEWVGLAVWLTGRSSELFPAPTRNDRKKQGCARRTNLAGDSRSRGLARSMGEARRRAAGSSDYTSRWKYFYASNIERAALDPTIGSPAHSWIRTPNSCVGSCAMTTSDASRYSTGGSKGLPSTYFALLSRMTFYLSIRQALFRSSHRPQLWKAADDAVPGRAGDEKLGGTSAVAPRSFRSWKKSRPS